MTTTFPIRRLTASDIPEMRSMLAMLGKAFGEIVTFTENPPRSSYLEKLLGSDTFIALAAFDGERVVGGLAAYVLLKFE